jgi:hypothetical protein
MVSVDGFEDFLPVKTSQTDMTIYIDDTATMVARQKPVKAQRKVAGRKDMKQQHKRDSRLFPKSSL